jgi:predicted nucleic acid-binding protein
MAVLCDTSFVFSLIDRADPQHAQCRALYLRLPDLLLPAPALTELAYLFHRTGGNMAVAGALRTIREGHMAIVDLDAADYDRVVEILTKYADSRIDFVDACIMALAERLRVARILTFDRRDFGLYRPAHCEHFELLP